jgi:threonyl-tRNA synthetase
MTERQVSVRRQGKGDLGAVALDDFTAQLVQEIAERRALD